MKKLHASGAAAALALSFLVTFDAPVAHAAVVTDLSNPRWIYDVSGQPIFICGPGDPEGFFFRGSLNADGTRSGDQDQLISRLVGTGANSMYLMAVRSHGGDGDATHNPFIDHDPAKGLDPDILDQWDGWLTALDQAGVVTHFFLYDDSARIWDTGDAVGAEEEVFVRAIVDRFEHIGHLVWVVAEEYAESYSTTRASALAAILEDADDAGHPISIHQNSGLNFDFASDAAIDQFAMQYNVGTADALHAGVVSAFESAGGRYQLMMSEAADWGTGATAREKAWACAMGGAYVMVLGMDVVSTPLSDLEDCGRVVEFFEASPFANMEPHDELARNDTRWVFAEPGEGYLLYSHAAATLGLDLPSGVWDLRWFDPATGAWVQQDDVATEGGNTSFAVPSGIGSEAALSIIRSDTTAVTPASWSSVKAAYR